MRLKILVSSVQDLLNRKPKYVSHDEIQKGMTLIETMIVVCLVSVFASVFIPAFVNALQLHKIDEASQNLLLLSKSVEKYYKQHDCLPAQLDPLPKDLKHTPQHFDVNQASDTRQVQLWTQLSFHPPSRLHYRYSIQSNYMHCDKNSSKKKDTITLRAEGDLNQDGHYSLFEQRMKINSNNELKPYGILHVFQRTN